MSRSLPQLLAEYRLMEGYSQLAAKWAEEAHPRGKSGKFVRVGDADADLGDPDTPAARKAKENIGEVLGDKADKYETGENEDGEVMARHEDVPQSFPVGTTLTSAVAGMVGFFDFVSGLAVHGIGLSGRLLAKAAADLEEGLRGIGAM